MTLKFKMGDWITYNNESGTVTGIRYTERVGKVSEEYLIEFDPDCRAEWFDADELTAPIVRAA